MFSFKNSVNKSLITSVLLLVMLFPSTIFAEKQEPDNQTIENTPAKSNLKKMPVNQVELMEKSNNVKVKKQGSMLSEFKVDQLNRNNELKLTQNTKARGSDGFYGYVTDYITAEGQEKFVYPIAVEPGEVLHAQLDLPNSGELDYDLYLFEVDPNTLDMNLIDISQSETFINGTEGTAPESVGVFNGEDQVKEYAVFIVSKAGASITQPFTLHIGINLNTDNFEADENVNWAVNFTLFPIGATLINTRSMDTLVDNDWYKFTIPASKNYDTMNFTLDEDAVNANYKIELYQAEGNKLKKVNISLKGKAKVDSGQYFIRVSAIESNRLTDSPYSLNILPDYQADEIYITDFAGGGYATYQFGRFYRVNGNSNLTISGVAGYKGYLLSDADVSVTVINEHWEPEHLRFRTATTKTNSDGGFTVDVKTSHSTAAYSFSSTGAFSYTHYFDYGYVQVNSGKAFDVEPLYFFAYSI